MLHYDYLCTVIMDKLYTHQYQLTAGQCTPQNELPLAALARQIIELATLHANTLNVGYERLRSLGLAWVLSRLTIEMSSWPTVNTSYTIETWVQSHNRRFSERTFRIADAEGNTLGYAHSVWMAINTTDRTGGDISPLTQLTDAILDRELPIVPLRRITLPDKPDREATYTFQYTDCDNNRHVNTARYIELTLNQWSLEHYDRYRVARYDISLHNECHCGDEVNVKVTDDSTEPIVAIVRSDNSVVSSRIAFQKR